MSVLSTRGGVPRVLRLSVDSTGRRYPLPFLTNYILVRNSVSTCRMYFKEVDFTGDVNYVALPLPDPQTPHGEWQGPVEAKELWFKSDAVGGSQVELVVFQRIG